MSYKRLHRDTTLEKSFASFWTSKKAPLLPIPDTPTPASLPTHHLRRVMLSATLSWVDIWKDLEHENYKMRFLFQYF
jgi:hypothetical protein